MKSTLATGFFLLALAPLFKARQVWIWKTTILATEYGHWLALATVAATGWLILARDGGLGIKLSLTMLLISTILFLRPVMLALANERAWINELTKNVSAPSTVLFSFGKLWINGVTDHTPETFEIGERKLSLNFYRAKEGPAPFVVVVHGGGWDSGDNSQFHNFNSHLVQQGYAVAAVSYRFAPEHKWPTQKHDVLEAIQYLKNHAKELNIDANRWAILGRSAGGQIAEGVAYQENDPTLKGLIAFYSPADLEFAYREAEPRDIINSRDLVSNYIGGDPDKNLKAYKDASPYFFAGRDSVPTLLLHGKMDPLTWNVQSRRLRDRISAAGGKIAYIEFPWATHAFDFNINGPAGQVASRAVDTFLETVFRG